MGAKVEFTDEEDGRVSMGSVSLVGPRARDIKVIEKPGAENAADIPVCKHER